MESQPQNPELILKTFTRLLTLETMESGPPQILNSELILKTFTHVLSLDTHKISLVSL